MSIEIETDDDYDTRKYFALETKFVRLLEADLDLKH